ncbi:MAG: HEPN domain-containing protein [Bacteroidota bacterium]
MQDENVEDWVRKAEGDFRTATRELQVKDSPNFDAVCYHSQQCAEKYLKAYLILQRQAYPKVHKLVEILNVCLTVDSSFEFIRQELETLTGLDTLRYPYDFAMIEEAQLAIQQATVIRRFLRQQLNLEK